MVFLKYSSWEQYYGKGLMFFLGLLVNLLNYIVLCAAKVYNTCTFSIFFGRLVSEWLSVLNALLSQCLPLLSPHQLPKLSVLQSFPSKTTWHLLCVYLVYANLCVHFLPHLNGSSLGAGNTFASLYSLSA